MTEIAQAKIKIYLPINIVYSFIANLENMVYYLPRIKKVEKDPENPDATGPGTKYYIYLNTLLGNTKKVWAELRSSEGHFHFEYKDSSSLITGYYFSEEPDGILVRLYKSTELSALASFLTLKTVSSRDTKIELEKTLLKIKTFLEAENYKAEESTNPEEQVISEELEVKE